MFTSIGSVTNFGVFRNYVAPQDLPAFARRNIIYGWNYSGKTTLSRLFACFERTAPHPDFSGGEFQFTLENGAQATAQSVQAPHCQVRVFNADYIRQNVRFEEGLTPVLLIGAANVALQDRLAMLGRQIDRRNRTQSTLRAAIDAIDTVLDDQATASATQIRQAWGRNPYTRVRLKEDAESIAANYEKFVLSQGEYDKKRSIRGAEDRPQVPLIQTPEAPKISDAMVRALVRSTAQRMTLDRLKKSQDIEQWVEAGLALHKHESTCHFCEGSLDEALLEKLSAHFSDSYAQLRSKVLEALAYLEESKAQLPRIDAIHIFPAYRQEFETAFSKANDAVAAYNAAVESLRTALSSKLQTLDTPSEAALSAPQDLHSDVRTSIADMNAVLSRHNDMCANLVAERRAAEDALVLNDVASYITASKYIKRMKRREELRNTLRSVETNESALKKQRALVQEQLSEEVRGADELNRYLRLYFGGDDLKVALRMNKTYAFQRSGQPAKNLSEGERTAIAFSYFLTTLRAKGLQIQDCVVFIDDPISSLDSNHIFNTFATIKFALKDARQLFISTHNYEFFRMMKSDSFFTQRKDQAPLTSYYLVRQRARGESELVVLPAMLLKYNSEYHYLFESLYKFHQDPAGNDQMVPNVPNMFRRLLETYTSFRVPNTAMNLEQRLLRVFPDPVISQRIYKLVNHLSHADGMSPATEFPPSQECQGSLNAFFEALKTDDPKHYEGMSDLIRQ